MSSLTFGRLCQMILEISRKEKLIDGWNKQVIVVNSLFQMAGIHNYYEPGACSYFINQKKEIPKGKRERLISKSLDDQAYLIAQKIRNENSQLPLQPLATSIRHFYQHPTFHEDAYYPYETAVTSPFQPDQLEQIYQAEDYPLFLAKVLLHLLIFVPNVQKRTECNLLNNKVRFNQHIQHFLDNQQYYEKFHRDLVIFPFMEEKYYKIVSDTSYSAYRINPRTPERDYFYYFFSFNNAFEQDAHQLAYLEINGIDYTDKVTSQLSLEYEREFPFVKRYMLKGIPHSDFYHVRMI